jgi:mono/diheme cytochrome c family protein
LRRCGAAIGCAIAALAAISSCYAADSAAPQYTEGAATFAANCAVCHGAAGAGTPGLAPPLTSYPARYAALAEGRRQLVLTVLYGMFGSISVEQQKFNFKMPDFARLDDRTLATVLNFIVFDLAHAPSATMLLAAPEIAAERSHALDGAAVREHRTSVLGSIGG